MREIICDSCKKQINVDTDVYFCIEFISFFVPTKKGVEIETFKEGDKTTWQQNESWSIYDGLDFCRWCWGKPEMKGLREIVKLKREKQ